jgi:hypothetical protein
MKLSYYCHMHYLLCPLFLKSTNKAYAQTIYQSYWEKNITQQSRVINGLFVRTMLSRGTVKITANSLANLDCTIIGRSALASYKLITQTNMVNELHSTMKLTGHIVTDAVVDEVSDFMMSDINTRVIKKTNAI